MNALRSAGVATPAAAILGTLFLIAFYRGVQHNWPGSYFQFGTGVDPIMSRSPFHYFFFRIGPVFFVGLFVVVTLRRLDEPEMVGLIGFFVLYGTVSNGVGILRTIKRDPKRGLRIARLTIQLLTLALMAAALVAVWFLRNALAVIVPEPKDISVALWTGVAVAALGGFLGQATEVAQRTPEVLLRRSYRELDKSTVEFLRSEAIANGTELDLALSILLVENLQRPRWVRKIERVKALVFKRGSYGVMQVAAPRWIDDRRSISIALSTFLKDAQVGRTEHGSSNHDRLAAAVRPYNPDDDYVQLVEEAYDTLPLIKLASTPPGPPSTTDWE